MSILLDRSSLLKPLCRKSELEQAEHMEASGGSVSPSIEPFTILRL